MGGNDLPSPDDIFYVIGFTRADIASGALHNLTSLSLKSLEEMRKLHQRVGPLAIAAAHGLVAKETIEVYFESALDAEQGRNFRNEYGEDYQTVQFLNETAMRLCREFGINLPNLIRTIRRNQLPLQHGTMVHGWTYSVSQR
jgi:hypothetical protein